MMTGNLFLYCFVFIRCQKIGNCTKSLNIDYIKFKDIDFIEAIQNNRLKKLNIYGKININNYMGRTSLQVFCNDYELVEDESRYDF